MLRRKTNSNNTIPTLPCASTPAGRRRQPVPARLRKIYVPLAVLEATNQAMQRFGSERRECYVWWGGYFTSDSAQVCTALVPEIATEYGCVELNNAELTALHARLRELDQVLITELHSHPPGAGGQNDIDAAHPAATYDGFTSVVVPDFAFPRFHDLRETFVYEYAQGGNWKALNRDEVEDRFVIESTCLTVSV